MTTPYIDEDIPRIIAIKAHLESLDKKEKIPEGLRVSHRTIALSATNPFLQLAGVDPGRKEIHIEVLDNQVVLSTSTSQASDAANGPASVVSTPPAAITTPPVPASTVAQQNTNQFAVQVVISAGTITNVSVNGITVGTAAGTYTVPANGAISITYSVAPTWAWTSLQANTVTSLQTPNGRILNPVVGEYVIPGGKNEIWFSAAQFPARVCTTIVRYAD